MKKLKTIFPVLLSLLPAYTASETSECLLEKSTADNATIYNYLGTVQSKRKMIATQLYTIPANRDNNFRPDLSMFVLSFTMLNKVGVSSFANNNV